MHSLRVELLGGFQLLIAGEPIPPPASRPARSLLAYLLLNHERFHSRPAIVGMFWPDDAETAGRRKLSQNLWRLREVLGPIGYADLVHAVGDSLGVNSDLVVEVDVHEFKQGIADQADVPSESSVRTLLKAVELYRGELLAGYYDDWVVEEQRLLHKSYLDALGRLVRGLKATGANEEALIYARKLTWHDPIREDAHRDVMRLCMLLNRPTEALRQYEQLEEYLFEEMGTEPETETRELFELIANKRRSERLVPLVPDPQAGPAFGPGPFIGRHTERAQAVDVIERTIGGQGSVVLVEGDPGVGKTRFLDEVSRAAAWRGVEVLRGSSLPGVSIPFGVVREALAAGMTPLRAEQLVEQVDDLWLSEVARVVPQLGEWLPHLEPAPPLRDGEGRDRIIEAIAIVLAAMGRITPHVVVFDDLHWADEDSVDLLRRVAVSPAMRRTSIFVAFRGGEGREREDVWNTLRELDRLGATVLAMEPLDGPESEELVRWAAGEDRAIAALAPRIHQETGGNPLFVIEATRALLEAGPVEDPESLPLTDDVRRLLAERLDRVTEAEREIVAALAAWGRSTGYQELFQWCELGRSDLSQGLMSLLNRRLVVETDVGYGVAHDLLRRVAYDSIPPPERVRLHRVIAETLEVDEWAEPAVVAHHLSEAGSTRRAFPYWLRAARQASHLHAYATAAELYARARSCLEEDDPAQSWIDLLAEYETVLGILGRAEEQREVLERWLALTADDERRWLEAQIRMAAFLGVQGKHEESIRLAQETAERAHRHGYPSHRAGLVAGRARHWSGDLEGARTELGRVAELAPDDAEVTVALGGVLGELEDYPAAAGELERARALFREADDPRGEAEALGLLAALSVETGTGAEIEAMFDQAVEVCRTIGYSRGEAVGLSNRSLFLYDRGRIAAALADLGRARDKFLACGNPRGEAIAALNEAMIHIRVLGDFDAGRRLIERLIPYFVENNAVGMLAHCDELLGLLAHATGELSAALRHIAAAIARAGDAGYMRRAAYARAARARILLERGEAQPAMADIAAARAGAPPDLALRLDAYAAWAVLAADPARAWEQAAPLASAPLEGVEVAWEIPAVAGRVALAAKRPREAAAAFARAHELLEAALAGLDEEQRRQAIDNLALHREIMDRWEAVQPRRFRVRLARAEVPTGRPLRPDELVEVEWVLERELLENGADGRRRGILTLAEQARTQGALPTVDDLAGVLEVSRATIKRDLDALRRAGTAPRTRGTRRTG